MNTFKPFALMLNLFFMIGVCATRNFMHLYSGVSRIMNFSGKIIYGNQFSFITGRETVISVKSRVPRFLILGARRLSGL